MAKDDLLLKMGFTQEEITLAEAENADINALYNAAVERQKAFYSESLKPTIEAKIKEAQKAQEAAILADTLKNLPEGVSLKSKDVAGATKELAAILKGDGSKKFTPDEMNAIRLEAQALKEELDTLKTSTIPVEKHNEEINEMRVESLRNAHIMGLGNKLVPSIPNDVVDGRFEREMSKYDIKIEDRKPVVYEKGKTGVRAIKQGANTFMSIQDVFEAVEKDPANAFLFKATPTVTTEEKKPASIENTREARRAAYK